MHVKLKIDDKIKNYPTFAKNEGDNIKQAQPYHSYGPSGFQRPNRFYALQTEEDHVGSLDVVFCKLSSLACDFAFLDIGYFISNSKTPYVVSAFKFDLKIFMEVP